MIQDSGSGGSRVRWIDSHAHLTMFDREEVGAVLVRAAGAGVDGVLVPATSLEDLEPALELARSFPERIVAAAGIHPHEAAGLDGAAKRNVERALGEAGVVAVGEIGLDYHYMNSPREDQMLALDWQLDVAVELGMPVVLHNRDSWSDLEAALASRAGRLRGVCHSFCEGPQEAARVVELGLMVGISGMVTFKRADAIREMTRTVPLDRLLVETDSPYLAPVPYRGRRNEPAYVSLVGEQVAHELGVDGAACAEATGVNCRKLFGLADQWARPGGGAGS